VARCQHYKFQKSELRLERERPAFRDSGTDAIAGLRCLVLAGLAR
jgi:hypothetical protein